MCWYKLLYCIPAPHQMIVMRCKHSDAEELFFICNSNEWQKIAGENDMNFAFTWWCKLPNLNGCDH